MAHHATPGYDLIMAEQVIHDYAMVQRGGPVPPSRQLAALLRAQIESGELQPGDALPSITTLAAEHHLATATVRKALNILKAESLIEGVPGYGTFVKQRD